MRKKSKKTIGIDIGDKFLKISSLTKIDQTYVIEHYDKYDISKFVSEGYITNTKKIESYIKEFIMKNNISKPKLIFIIGNKNNDYMRTRIFKMPILNKKEELKKAIDIEADNIFSLSDDAHTIQWKILNQSFQNQTLIYATCFKKDIIKPYEKIAQNLKYSFSIIPKNIVLNNILDTENKTALFIDFGYNTCDFTIYHNNMPLIVKTINNGGLSITSVIAAFKGITLEEAEELKIRDGILIKEELLNDFSYEHIELSNIISTQIEMLINEIKRLEQQIFEEFNINIDEISIYGGSSDITFLPQYIENKINIPCSKTIPSFLNENKNNNLLEESSNYINSFAASLLEYKNPIIELYLLDEIVIDEKLPFFIGLITSLTIVAISIISISSNIVANKYYDKSVKNLNMITSQYKEFENSANSMIDQINNYNNQITEVSNTLDVLDTIANKKVLPSDILYLLKTHTPTKVQLDSVSYINNKITLEGVVSDYLNLGYYIKELETVNNFTKIDFEYSDIYTPISNSSKSMIKNLKFKIYIDYSKNEAVYNSNTDINSTNE